MRLGRWHQLTIYATLAIVAASGFVWFFLHDFLEEEPSELQRLSLVTHGVAAFAALIVIGSLLPLHVRSSWTARRNVMTGASLLSVMSLLIVTALFLYYGGEETRAPARWIHIGAGVISVAAISIHVIVGRLIRKKSPSPLAGARSKRERPAPAA